MYLTMYLAVVSVSLHHEITLKAPHFWKLIDPVFYSGIVGA